MPASTVDVEKITLENRSEAVASVKFDLSTYPEFKITESKYHWESEMVERFVLEKHTSKTLFVHFIPIAITTDKFIIPTVLNDILGPVTDEVTSKVAYYMIDLVPDSTLIKMPFALPIPKIQCYCTEPKLNLSTWIIKLSFSYPPNDFENVYNLRICNPQLVADDICIRTDQLSDPFCLNLSSEKDITKYENSIVFTLCPNESIFFTVSFNPGMMGPYQAVLPVYLKSEMSMKPHNQLYIEGSFPYPTITCYNPVTYTMPVALKLKISRSLIFAFENHFSNCTVKCMSDVHSVDVEVDDSYPYVDNKRDVIIKVVFAAEKSAVVRMIISVTCTCGARCDSPIYGSQENCLLTNYALVSTYIVNPEYNMELKREVSYDLVSRLSIMSILDEPQMHLIEEYDISDLCVQYPFFPNEDDGYADIMNTSIAIMESWVYTQGFYGTSFYKIPEGIQHVVHEVESNRKDQKCKPPFIELLINLAGKQIEDYLELGRPSDDKAERTRYYCHVYARALEFLTNLGAHFTYIKPEYMVDYKMYCTYIKDMSPADIDEKFIQIKDHQEFYRLSKQCWLDVILQTYKVLVLFRLIKSQETKFLSPPLVRYRKSIKHIIKNAHLFSNAELLLLNWLEFHYNEVRCSFWSDNQHLGTKEASFIGEELSDGFVYAAVTLAYCPYLAKHFRKLCLNPISSEEFLHNNIIVVQSWNMLNFSIDVSVQYLTHPHSIGSLIFIAYLFEILPDMYPSETVELNTGLSTKITKTLTIANSNAFIVAYKAILLGNEDGCFATNKSFFVIQPKHKLKIVVTYWAKFIKHSQCTLILSGECRGYHYAKSKVVSLIGKPDVTYMAGVIQFEVVLQEPQEKALTIKSPYSTDTETFYKIQATGSECSTIGNVNALPYNFNIFKSGLQRIIPLEEEIVIDQTGVARMNVLILAMTTRKIPMWFYFRNSKTGDFAFQIWTTVNPRINGEVLEVILPEPLDEIDFQSRTNNKALLSLPCQNRLLWLSVAKVILKLHTDEKKFWSNVIYTTAGMHLLQKLVQLTPSPYSFNLVKSPPYKIIVQKNNAVRLPALVDFQDEYSAEFVEVSVEFLNAKACRKGFGLRLESTEYSHNRCYWVNVVLSSKETQDD